MKNGITIDGRLIELSRDSMAEILAISNIKLESDFDFKAGDRCVLINSDGRIENEAYGDHCQQLEKAGNLYPASYKDLVHQLALDRILHDRLLRFSLENKDEKASKNFYEIYYVDIEDKFIWLLNRGFKNLNTVCFSSHIAAERAIEEIIKPFLNEFPEYDLYKRSQTCINHKK